jgi:hypothetical protein
MKGGLALSIASRRTGFLPYSQTQGKAILEPLQIAVNQRPAEAKITFETSETTFEVISLRSYVSILLCGTIFREWGMPFSKWWAAPAVSDGEVIPVEQEDDNI